MKDVRTLHCNGIPCEIFVKGYSKEQTVKKATNHSCHNNDGFFPVNGKLKLSEIKRRLNIPVNRHDKLMMEQKSIEDQMRKLNEQRNLIDRKINLHVELSSNNSRRIKKRTFDEAFAEMSDNSEHVNSKRLLTNTGSHLPLSQL